LFSISDKVDLRVPALKLGWRSADVVAREVISGTPEVIVVTFEMFWKLLFESSIFELDDVDIVGLEEVLETITGLD